jgi:hypothetical protein
MIHYAAKEVGCSSGVPLFQFQLFMSRAVLPSWFAAWLELFSFFLFPRNRLVFVVLLLLLFPFIDQVVLYLDNRWLCIPEAFELLEWCGRARGDGFLFASVDVVPPAADAAQHSDPEGSHDHSRSSEERTGWHPGRLEGDGIVAPVAAAAAAAHSRHFK